MKQTVVKIVAVREEPNTPCWPCINHDADKELSRIVGTIRGMNPDMAFDVVSYTHVDQAKADYEADLARYDGVLVLLMTCWKQIELFYARQSREGIPTVIADVPYCGSGSVLCQSAPTVRAENLPTQVLSTLDYAEIAKTVKLFDVLAKIKQTKILVIANRDRTTHAAAFESEWGCRFIFRTGKELNEYLPRVSEAEAKQIADRWQREAVEVREATEADVLESARLHIAIRAMMEKEGADAVTLDCLSLSYEGDYTDNAHMYPCLSHYEMLRQGTVAVCEADLEATVTSLIVRYLTNKPGYVSDPVIDTSSNQIIYAHCVGCTKVHGYDDPRCCQYAIRSHAEDQKGASVQITFPAGEPLTTTMVYPKTVGHSVIHSSRSVGNVGLQEACRSKLAAEADAKAILNGWSGGWHRVTVFGDYREQLLQLYQMKSLDVTEEDR